MSDVKPILFNIEMVRALLAGRKTVTRRVVKPQPHCYGPSVAYPKHEEKFFIDQNAGWLQCSVCGNFPQYSREGTEVCHFWAPLYRPGDILYVRETFKIDFLSNIPGSGKIHYKADDTYSDFTFAPERYEMMRRAQLKPGWRPNENMPREAARIFLRVMDVRVERLRPISDTACMAEGITCAWNVDLPDAFAEMWDSTIKPEDRTLYGWDANPWVWVIEFERTEKP